MLEQQYIFSLLADGPERAENIFQFAARKKLHKQYICSKKLATDFIDSLLILLLMRNEVNIKLHKDIDAKLSLPVLFCFKKQHTHNGLRSNGSCTTAELNVYLCVYTCGQCV